MTSKVSFEVVGNVDDVPGLRECWGTWSKGPSASPFAFPGFFAAWVRAYGRDRRAFLVVGRRAGRPAFVLPFWHAHRTPEQWMTLGAHRADYSEAAIFEDDHRMAAAFWRWIVAEAPCRGAKITRVPASSALGRALPESALERTGRLLALARTALTRRRLSYLIAWRQHEHPIADKARIQELGAQLESRNLKRKMNVLARSGNLTYEVVRDRAAIQKLLPAFFAMHVSSFNATGRSSRFESGADREFYEALADAPDLDGVFYMDVLRVGDRACALHVGFENTGTLYWYKPAFDPELGKGSPGRVLLAHLYERAAQEGIETIDLLKGSEAYKAEWASGTRETFAVTLHRRKLTELLKIAVPT